MSGPIRDLIWEPGQEPAPARRLTPAALYALLVLVVLVLGLNWPIMATAVQYVTPMWMGVFRLGAATLVVIGIAAGTGRLKLPPSADLPIVFSLALFRLAGVTLLVFTALQMIPPGRSSVVAWTTPLWAVPIAAIFLGESMTRRRWVGLTMGITGVVVLFEPWGLDWANIDVVVGHALLITGAITNASTSVHIRGHRWTITPREQITLGLLAGLVLVTLGVTVNLLSDGGLPGRRVPGKGV